MNNLEEISKGDWVNLELSSAKFILDQAEKNLSESIKAADQITNKALSTIKFFVPLSIGLIAYMSSNFQWNSLLFQLSFIGILFSMTIIILCLNVYHIYKVKPLGNSPNHMLSPDYINNENQELLLVFNSIRTAQECLDFNKMENKKRIIKIKYVYRTIVSGIIVLVLYSIIWSLIANLP